MSDVETLTRKNIPTIFKERPGEYQEVRFDINPEVHPDILCDMQTMDMVEDGSMDGLHSCHNIEHVFTHEIPVTLKNFYRVLSAGGLLCIMCPDVQAVAGPITAGYTLWPYRLA